MQAEVMIQRKIKPPAPETMLQTVYARAKESSAEVRSTDAKDERTHRKAGLRFYPADKDTAMRSGVILPGPLCWIKLTTVVCGERQVRWSSILPAGWIPAIGCRVMRIA